MVLKYYIGKMNQGFYEVENLFSDALKEFDFLNIVDYDGESLNLILKNSNLGTDKEFEIVSKIDTVLKTTSLCA